MIKPVQRERNGFAMLVIFLMAAAVAITLYFEMPRVAFESQRNREELLMSRGQQYQRAIELYYRKNKRYPQKIEDLENTNNFRFLRRRYTDPLTGKDEWRMVHMGPAGLTDSLVEKMPGLDGNKNGSGTQTAGGGMGGGMGSGGGFGTPMANTATTTTQVADPNAPKTADDVVVGANRTERDQRALAAQRGQAQRILQPGDPGYDPYVAKLQQEEAERRAANGGADNTNADPNAQFQQQLLADYQKQQQATQQQLQGNNPNADPNQQPQPMPQQPMNPAQAALMGNGNNNNSNAFPPVGSPNGPVRTLYPQNNNPFSAGNQIRSGNSPFAPQAPPPAPNGQAPPVAASGGTIPSAFNVPQAVRDQLTRPGGATPAAASNNAFGGSGIAGVASTATGTGIKRYNERGKYKEWEFVYDYRKPAKGAQKGVTGVGGLNTSGGGNQQQQPQRPSGMQGLFGSGGNR